jgi:hypothetical protein
VIKLQFYKILEVGVIELLVVDSNVIWLQWFRSTFDLGRDKLDLAVLEVLLVELIYSSAS